MNSVIPVRSKLQNLLHPRLALSHKEEEEEKINNLHHLHSQRLIISPSFHAHLSHNVLESPSQQLHKNLPANLCSNNDSPR